MSAQNANAGLAPGALETTHDGDKHTTEDAAPGFTVLFRPRVSGREFRYLQTAVSEAFAKRTVAHLRKLGIDARCEAAS